VTSHISGTGLDSCGRNPERSAKTEDSEAAVLSNILQASGQTKCQLRNNFHNAMSVNQSIDEASKIATNGNNFISLLYIQFLFFYFIGLFSRDYSRRDPVLQRFPKEKLWTLLKQDLFTDWIPYPSCCSTHSVKAKHQRGFTSKSTKTS